MKYKQLHNFLIKQRWTQIISDDAHIEQNHATYAKYGIFLTAHYYYDKNYYVSVTVPSYGGAKRVWLGQPSKKEIINVMGSFIMKEWLL